METTFLSQASLLASEIDGLVERLTWAGEDRWREKLAHCAHKLREGDLTGCDEFLGCFGTSGSFNECSIGDGAWTDGKFQWLPGHEDQYLRFEKMKEVAYVQARELSRAAAPTLRMLIKEGFLQSSRSTKALLAVLFVSVLVLVSYAIWREGA